MTRIATSFVLAVLGLGLGLHAGPAQAHLMWCYFSLPDCPPEGPCGGFEVTIDTHHGPDGPTLTRAGITVPVTVAPDETTRFPSYVSHGAGEREVVSLLGGHAAAYSRHSIRDGLPAAEATTGDCRD